MKKILRIVLIIAAVLAVLFFVFKKWTKSHSPVAKAFVEYNGLAVNVDYCQPYMKGRTIFGSLVPYEKVWRTGANEATLITFSRDAKVAGSELKAGTYSLWTVPTASDWEIIFNAQTGQWGTMYDEKEDVLRVKVPSEKTSNASEQLNIGFTEGDSTGLHMNIKWENTLVNVPIE